MKHRSGCEIRYARNYTHEKKGWGPRRIDDQTGAWSWEYKLRPSDYGVLFDPNQTDGDRQFDVGPRRNRG